MMNTAIRALLSTLILLSLSCAGSGHMNDEGNRLLAGALMHHLK